MKTICKLLFTIALASAPLFADATEAKPKKIGPVSYYGALHTQGNKIIGAKNNQQAMLRGISLFWSDATGQPYYKNTVISWAVDNLKIDVFRFAMGIQYYDSNGGSAEPLISSNSYMGNPEGYMNLLDRMVAAAVENDVYIVVDWHSHRAQNETAAAKTFFENVAKKYKDIPNIIYEIYNEPVGVGWSNVKSYANSVIPNIRNYTDNLIIVGTPNWSQHPEEGAADPVTGTNIAYVLHFYAASHSASSYSGNITSALGKGHPVFISEWGTTSANGDGTPSSSASDEWIRYMEANHIPNCNWSLRQYTSHTDGKSEESAFFAGNSVLMSEQSLSGAELTASGTIVKKYLVDHASSWPDSVTKGHRNGNCAVDHIKAKETDGSVSGKLKSGCSYESSDPSVVTVSGSNLTIKSHGFAILTANDGSQTAVIIQSIPSQTINGFMGVTCDYVGSCTTDRGSDRSLDYDEDGKKEWTFPPSTETDQGSSFTLESLDPDIINVKKVKCKSYSCSGAQRDADAIWMYEYNSFGEARIVATASAVPGYRALNDTIVVSYVKAKNRIPGFGNQKLALGETGEEFLPDTSIFGTPITYTFDGEKTSPYLQKVGINAVAGNQNAIVQVTAKMEETDILEPYEKTVTFIIGDTTIAVDSSENKSDFIQNYATLQGLRANVAGRMLHISSSKPAPIYVDIYDMLGNRAFQQLTIDPSKSPSVSLGGLPQGSYVVRIRQQSQKLTLRWTNR